MNLRRVQAVALKEWRETVRDRMFLLLAFLLPVLWLLVFGYGSRYRSQRWIMTDRS